MKIYKGSTYKSISDAMIKDLSACRDITRRHIVVVPEKLTLSTEASILNGIESQGSFNIEVYGFSRLASVLGAASPSELYLQRHSAIMVVKKIVNENADNLQCYKNIGSNGFCSAVYNVLLRLMHNNILPQDLPSDLSSYPRLADIALIYKKYREHTMHSFCDNAERMRLLLQSIPSLNLKDCNFYFKDFDFLSPLELKIVAMLAKHSDSVAVGCTFNSSFINNNSYFNAVADTMADNNIAVEIVNIADASARVQHILKNTLCYTTPKRLQNSSLRLFADKDIHSEVEFAARQIRSGVLGGKRYLDSTVIVSDAEKYRYAVAEIFSRYEIPYFLDIPQPLTAQPLCRFLVDCLKNRNSENNAFDITKNYYFGANSDILETFCVQHNITNLDVSFAKQVKPDQFDEQAESVRSRLCQILGKLKVNEGDSVQNYTTAVLTFLQDIDAENLTEQYARDLKSIGTDYYAECNTQTYGKLVEVINSLNRIMPDYFLVLGDYIEMLLEGLDSQHISVLPMYLDGVFIGQTDTAKYHSITDLYVLGVNDGDFPKIIRDDGLLSDDDISVLNRPLNPSVRNVNMRCRFNACQLLTEPSGMLCVSTSGDTISTVITDLSRMFCTEQNPESDYPIINLSASTQFEAYSGGQCGLQIVQKSRAYLDGALDSSQFSAVSKVYNALKSTPHIKTTEKFLQMLNYTNSVTVPQTPAAVDKLSVSQLESYLRCPYKYFVQYVLKPQHTESGITSLDIGNIFHTILEKFLADAHAFTEFESRSTAVINEVLDNYPLNTVRRKRLFEEAKRVCAAVVRQIENSDFKVWGREVGIGDTLPAIEVTCNEKTVRIIGVIDRLDILDDKYVRIIDYKTGNSKFDFGSSYFGTRLQIFAYLLAASKGLDKQPVGAYYYLINNDFYQQDSPPLSFSGVTLNDIKIALASDLSLNSQNLTSGIFDITLKNSDGLLTVSDKSCVFSSADFDAMLQRTQQLIQTAVDGILNNEFSISPYAVGCAYCDFSTVCKYQTEYNQPHKKTTGVNKKNL